MFYLKSHQYTHPFPTMGILQNPLNILGEAGSKNNAPTYIELFFKQDVLVLWLLITCYFNCQ